MGEERLFIDIQKLLKDHKNKSRFLAGLKSSLFYKKTSYEVDFDIIIIGLQNRVEDIFDRILRSYTRPKQKYQYMYDNEINQSIAVQLSPEDVRSQIISNFGFGDKKNLIYKLFKIPKIMRTVIDKLNEIRNAIAHRYSRDDKRFVYKGKNVLCDLNELPFLNDVFEGINELLAIETKLLDAIDKAEDELG